MSLPPWYSPWLQSGLAVNERTVFFVGGCQKSGTTWLQHLLNAHPAVCCGGEGHLANLLTGLLQQAVNAYNQRQARRAADLQVMLGREDLLGSAKMLGDRILAGYLPQGEAAGAVRAVGDKTPEHAVGMDLLAELYPAAKFVNVIRDGRDACISGWFHLQRQGQAGKFASLADYAAYFAEHHWVKYITAARAAAGRMPGRCLEMRYEALHAEPEGQTRRLLEFLGVDSGEEAVAACVAGGSFRKLTGGRERGQEDAGSFYRKGVVGDWKQQMDDAAHRRFQDSAGALLTELGYSESSAVAV